MNDASHVSNVTSKLFQFLIDTRCQVVNSYTFVAAASCYDITAYKEHHLSVTVVLIIHYYTTQLSSYKITNAQLQFLAFCSPSAHFACSPQIRPLRFPKETSEIAKVRL